MKILVVPLLIYPVWGIPSLIIFNIFFTRYLYANNPMLQAAGIALIVSLLIFAPLVIPSNSFFGEVYMPWYIAPFMTPPAVEFSLLGLFATFITSFMSIGLTILLTKK